MADRKSYGTSILRGAFSICVVFGRKRRIEDVLLGDALTINVFWRTEEGATERKLLESGDVYLRNVEKTFTLHDAWLSTTGGLTGLHCVVCGFCRDGNDDRI